MFTVYSLFQKKCNFILSIFPGAPGSLTLTKGLDGFVVEMMYNPRLTGVHYSQQERQLQKVVFLLEKSVVVKSHVKVCSSMWIGEKVQGLNPEQAFFI